MSGKLVAEIHKIKLTHAQREILMVMAECCQNDQGCGIDCGVRYIAWATEYSERQVQRIQRQLEVKQILVAVEKPKGKPIVWQIDTSKGDKKPAFASKQKTQRGDINVSPHGDGTGDTQMSGVAPFGGDTQMSPHGNDGVTSHGRDENAGGDMPSANLSRYRKEEKIKDQENRAREQFAVYVRGGHDTYADGKFIDPMTRDFQNACNDIFYAWYNELQALGRAPDTSLENLWAMHREAAIALAKNRRKPEDVAAYVKAMYTGDDAFWRNAVTPMKLAAVSNNIGNWLQSKKRVAPPEVINAGQKLVYIDPGTNHYARKPVAAVQS